MLELVTSLSLWKGLQLLGTVVAGVLGAIGVYQWSRGREAVKQLAKERDERAKIEAMREADAKGPRTAGDAVKRLDEGSF